MLGVCLYVFLCCYLGMNKAFGIAIVGSPKGSSGSRSPNFTPQSPSGYRPRRRVSATGWYKG